MRRFYYRGNILMFENFDFSEFLKSLFSLDNSYGKKLVTITYYVMLAAIAVNAAASFIGGIACVASGAVLSGIGKILFCVPLAFVYVVILRLLCEVINAIFDYCQK